MEIWGITKLFSSVTFRILIWIRTLSVQSVSKCRGLLGKGPVGVGKLQPAAV